MYLHANTKLGLAGRFALAQAIEGGRRRIAGGTAGWRRAGTPAARCPNYGAQGHTARSQAVLRSAASHTPVVTTASAAKLRDEIKKLRRELNAPAESVA